MCANYTPVTQRELVKLHFDAGGDWEPLPPEAWPGSVAPFIRQVEHEGIKGREVSVGRFGLLPHWAKDPGFGKMTYNARSETVHEKPSFRDAWRKAQRCIIPAEMIFEPNFETGKAVRWGISRLDGKPMGLAGLWSVWRTPQGEFWDSFTMLTINAQSHPLMNRFHRPDDEKRMVVILPEAAFDAWLEGTEKEARDLLAPFAAKDMQAEPKPLIRTRSVPVTSKSPNAGDLFA